MPDAGSTNTLPDPDNSQIPAAGEPTAAIDPQAVAPVPRNRNQPPRKPRYINPPDPPLNPPPSKVMKAIDTLGLPKARWERAKLMAALEFGHFMTVKVVSRISMATTFDTLNQVQDGLSIAGVLAKDPNIATEFRLSAVNTIAACAKAHKDLTSQLVDLAEKAHEKAEPERVRNLPPQVALQVNVSGQSGNNGRSQAAISETTAESNPTAE